MQRQPQPCADAERQRGGAAVERHLHIRGEDRSEERGGRQRPEPPRARGRKQCRARDLSEPAGGNERGGVGAQWRGDDAPVRAGGDEMERPRPDEQCAQPDQRGARGCDYSAFLCHRPVCSSFA